MDLLLLLLSNFIHVRLSDPMDCSPPGSSVQGIFQARVPERGAIAFSVMDLQRLLNICIYVFTKFAKFPALIFYYYFFQFTIFSSESQSHESMSSFLSTSYLFLDTILKYISSITPASVVVCTVFC